MTANAGPNPRYLLDTNIIIDLGERLYPPDVFTALWQIFEATLGNGEIIVGQVVLAEMKRVKNPEPWRQRVFALCAPHAADETRPAVQLVFQRLSGNVAAGLLSAKLSDNDLLLLSCAEVDGIRIVTNDSKMKQACDRGLARAAYADLIEVFRTYQWQF
jgi:predicted nucleic acid-binding protein